MKLYDFTRASFTHCYNFAYHDKPISGIILDSSTAIGGEAPGITFSPVELTLGIAMEQTLQPTATTTPAHIPVRVLNSSELPLIFGTHEIRGPRTDFESPASHRVQDLQLVFISDPEAGLDKVPWGGERGCGIFMGW
ncbi:hypothetical protein BJ875DRAFT_480496 [Amylocarpus encephaloides]|uniref:Uncharacterized protein n=1 Tax=Amylocarpus encephaloides TaxID=45428 RepID=A0A9P7YRA7_9HELO|nr:hypothetical protein BJ875DRAFT_480496 [Amylocarpus encephaloides]